MSRCQHTKVKYKKNKGKNSIVKNLQFSHTFLHSFASVAEKTRWKQEVRRDQDEQIKLWSASFPARRLRNFCRRNFALFFFAPTRFLYSHEVFINIFEPFARRNKLQN